MTVKEIVDESLESVIPGCLAAGFEDEGTMSAGRRDSFAFTQDGDSGSVKECVFEVFPYVVYGLLRGVNEVGAIETIVAEVVVDEFEGRKIE